MSSQSFVNCVQSSRLALILLCLTTGLAATYASANPITITINVDAGLTRINNVGAGVPEIITDHGTEINIQLTTQQGQILETAIELPAGAAWVKNPNDPTKYKVTGIGPNDPFWCIIEVLRWGPGGGGGGTQLTKRWTSVSDIDIDADTDNTALGVPHRTPQLTDTEDFAEHPVGPASAEVLGLLIPIDDNIDVVDTWRDASILGTFDYQKDPDILDAVMTVHARKKGVWDKLLSTTTLELFDVDGNEIDTGDVAFEENATINLRLWATWDATPGKQDYWFGEFKPDAPHTLAFSQDKLFILPLGVDFDVDSDNDGSIDLVNEAAEGEDFLEGHDDDSVQLTILHPDHRYGMLVGLNVDDDDANGNFDNGWNGSDWTGPDASTIQGTPDEADLFPGALRWLDLDSFQKGELDGKGAMIEFVKISGPGAIRIFDVDFGEIGVFDNDNDRSSTVANGAAGGKIWDELVGSGIDMSLYVEGLRSGEVMMAVDLVLDGITFHRDVVRITVATFDVDAGDYIVPGSNKNIVRYSWPTEIQGAPDTVAMKVYDKNDVLVRSDAGLPTAYAGGQQYAEYLWDGMEQQGGNTPLTEAASPYTIVIEGSWGSRVYRGTIDDRKVKEWYLTLHIQDTEAFADATVSGVDKDTVTTAGNKVLMSREFVDDPGTIDLVDSFTASDDGKHANAVPKRGAAPTEYFLFYTTPNTPAYADIIEYKLTTRVSPTGAVDKAANQWDMDGSTTDKWENRGVWEFTISETGDIEDFTETYTEEP